MHLSHLRFVPFLACTLAAALLSSCCSDGGRLESPAVRATIKVAAGDFERSYWWTRSDPASGTSEREVTTGSQIFISVDGTGMHQDIYFLVHADPKKPGRGLIDPNTISPHTAARARGDSLTLVCQKITIEPGEFSGRIKIGASDPQPVSAHRPITLHVPIGLGTTLVVNGDEAHLTYLHVSVGGAVSLSGNTAIGTVIQPLWSKPAVLKLNLPPRPAK
jgi:hypothetical protein